MHTYSQTAQLFAAAAMPSIEELAASSRRRRQRRAQHNHRAYTLLHHTGRRRAGGMHNAPNTCKHTCQLLACPWHDCNASVANVPATNPLHARVRSRDVSCVLPANAGASSAITSQPSMPMLAVMTGVHTQYQESGANQSNNPQSVHAYAQTALQRRFTELHAPPRSRHVICVIPSSA